MKPGTSDASPLRVLSFPLMPADPARRGEVVEAPPDWSLDPTVFDPEADTLVWGRAANRSSLLRSVVRHAAAREAALRTIRRRVPSHLRLVAVHRLPPRQLESRGLRGGIRAAARSGALVELSSLPSGARILDRVLAGAEVTRSEHGFHAGAGGAMLIRVALPDGAEALLRVARAGAPGDPASSADILERLSGAGVPLTPRVHARGQTAGASWIIERALPGRRPARATDELARQVAALCAAFPRGDGAPTATAADLSGIADRLPDKAGALNRLAGEHSGQVRSLPSVLRHGDLWAGNLLVDRGRLSGLVDWDATHPAAVPGADVLQLVATELRRRARRGLGPAFLTRPWRSPMFSQATGGYWAELGLRPDDALLDVVGIAWWATEVHGTLARLPHRAADERWVTKNVDGVLSALGY
ncbi:MAG: phosphotransferase [Gaiellaceae bacterium]